MRALGRALLERRRGTVSRAAGLRSVGLRSAGLRPGRRTCAVRGAHLQGQAYDELAARAQAFAARLDAAAMHFNGTSWRFFASTAQTFSAADLLLRSMAERVPGLRSVSSRRQR